MTHQTFRVRFTEWQAFALDIHAGSQERAIQIGQAIRETLGTIDFEEIDGGTEGWDAELIHDAPPARTPIAKKAKGGAP
jgi:hypothetical protein